MDKKINTTDLKESFKKEKDINYLLGKSKENKLVQKYQSLFDEYLKKRNDSLHDAIITGDRSEWNKYNEVVFILIDVIEDFRKISKHPRIELNPFMEEHPEFKINSISILNIEEDIPMDENSFFIT